MTTIRKLSVALALCAVAGIAAADNGDSSMNPYTGDSWAALQGHGRNLGQRTPDVTVRIAKPARGAPAREPAPVAQTNKDIDPGHHPAPASREAAAG